MIGLNNSTTRVLIQKFFLNRYYISISRGYPAERTNKLIKHKDGSRILYSDSLSANFVFKIILSLT